MSGRSSSHEWYPKRSSGPYSNPAAMKWWLGGIQQDPHGAPLVFRPKRDPWDHLKRT